MNECIKKNTKRTLRCTEQKICFEYGSSKIFNKQIIKKKYYKNSHMFDKTLIVSTFHKECGNNKNKKLKEINLSKY